MVKISHFLSSIISLSCLFIIIYSSYYNYEANDKKAVAISKKWGKLELTPAYRQAGPKCPTSWIMRLDPGIGQQQIRWSFGLGMGEFHQRRANSFPYP